jgi:glycine/D-amino acid oxidase-like deaminating enzyme
MTDVVVCGAGIAGVSTAFHLTRAGIKDVVIVDPRPPLTLTSDKSTECYRNWWPNEPMVRLMGRSIELLDIYAQESDNVFGLNRRGYLYLTADAVRLVAMARQAEAASVAGAGELRVHELDSTGYTPADPEGFERAPGGADLFLKGHLLRDHFPFVSDHVVGGLHARTAGWLSAQQLGTWLLEQAEAAGAEFVRARVTGVETDAGRVSAVTLSDGSTLATEIFVNAAGPMLAEVGRMVGVDLPVESEVHAKSAFRDHLGALPRTAPMIIWNDPQRISWSTDETGYLQQEGRADLVGVLPPGCHARPEGGSESPWVLGLWEYHNEVRDPEWPIPTDPLYTEAVLRGLATMVPGLSGYQDHLPEAVVDAGYYTRTQENRPLAGPAGPAGAYVCGALSGFGIMAACGVGELVATAISGRTLPDWAHWFDLRRYDDPAYVAEIASLEDSGQL